MISRKQLAGMAQARPPTPAMIPFRGGLDQETPPLQQQSGFCRKAQNYEANVNGGYDRIKGYECFDGRPAPSDAQYTYLECTSITGGVVGDTLTGAGGATGKIIVVTSTYFVVTKRNGTAYVIGENLNVGAGTIAVASTIGVVSGAPTTLLHAQWLNLAADVYRADIAVPTGSGSSLGGIRFGGVTYTFRNNAGDTAVDVWKSTASGWVPTIQWEMAFTSGGTTEIIATNTITGETSGATAIIASVILKSGTWAGGNAAGVFVFTSQTGTFSATETVKVGAVLDLATVTAAAAPSLLYEISFTVGAVAVPAEGATLTQGGVTAILKRVVLTSGTFSGGTAAGRFIITNPAGGNFGAGAATLTGGVTCNLTAIQTAIILAPGGRYEFVVENFGGSTATKRIYGASGTHRGFEFDGTVLVPITTGMTTDTPNHVYTHKNHLFFSFGASVQHAGPGTPYVWSVILGAAELAMGDTVNGFMTQPGSEAVGALAIFTRNRTSILYGTGATDWQLVTYRAELGAYPYTVQDTGKTMFLDDQGVMTLETAQAFGNFSHNAITQRLKSWVNAQRTKAVESCISRDKSQYRLFFSDGYALYVTFAQTSKGKVYYLMPMLFPNPVTWAYSSEESDGSETTFFGSTNGMVYQMEKGTSFDGAEIEHFLYLAWDFLKSPRTLKRFYDCTLEIAGAGYAAFSFTYELGYASADVGQPSSQAAVTSFSAGVWDTGTYELGVWDGQTLMPSHFDMPGEGENISLVIRGSSDYHEVSKLSGALIHYSPRRELR